MGIADRVRAWLRLEREEAGQLLAEAEQRLDADLARRERDLAATPDERLDALRGQIADNDAELDAIRRRLGGDDPGPVTDPGRTGGTG